jgi:hypothetical protein
LRLKLKSKPVKTLISGVVFLLLVGVMPYVFVANSAIAAGEFCDPNAYAKQVKHNKDKVYLDEEFIIYGEIQTPPEQPYPRLCRQLTSLRLIISFTIDSNETISDSGTSVISRQTGSGTALFKFDEVRTTFIGGFKGKIFDIFQSKFEEINQNYKDSGWIGNTTRPVKTVVTLQGGAKDLEVANFTFQVSRRANVNDPPNSVTDTSVPTSFDTTGGGANKLDYKRSELGMTLSKVFSEYRVVANQPVSISFHLEYQNKDLAQQPVANISKVDGIPFRDIYVGANYSSCQSSDGRNCDKSKVLEGSVVTKTTSLPFDNRVSVPVRWIYETADYKEKVNQNAQDGQPMYARQFIVVPVLGLGSGSDIQDAVGTVGQPITTTIKVYKTQDSLKKACLDEGRTEAECNSLEAGHGGTEQSSTTTATAAKEGGTVIGGVVKIVADIVQVIVLIISEVIYFLFIGLIVPLIEAMLRIQTFKDNFVQVIYPGWQIVRNLGNIFFILILLFIALSTLFKISGSGQYKDLLVKLVIGAVLINFSLVIAQAVLGLADTAQNQFLPANSEPIKKLAATLMTAPIEQASYSLNVNGAEAFSDLLNPIFFLALSIGSFLVMGSIAVYLVIRVVMLWILLLLSPVPYFTMILPNTKRYADQWWKTFIKYAFFTPLIAFFLNLTASIAVKYPQILQGVGALTDDNRGGLSNDIVAFVLRVGSTVILLVFLVVSIQVAKSLGIYGAGAITGFVEKGTFKPLLGAASLGKAGASAGFARGVEGVRNFTGVDLSPSNWKKAGKAFFEKRAKERQEKFESGGFKYGSLAQKIPRLATAGLNRPTDFVENYFPIDVKNLKRFIASRAGLRGESKVKPKIEEFTDKTKILTEDERKKKEEEVQRSGRIADSLLRVEKTTGQEIYQKLDLATKNKEREVEQYLQQLKGPLSTAQASALNTKVSESRIELRELEANRDKLKQSLDQTADGQKTSLDQEFIASKYFENQIANDPNFSGKLNFSTDVGREMAEQITDVLRSELDKLSDERDAAYKKGNAKEAEQKEKEIAKLQGYRSAIDSQLRQPGKDAITIDPGALANKEVKEKAFNATDYKQQLQSEVTQLQNELTNDSDLRSKYNISTWDDPDREKAQDDLAKAKKILSEVERPAPGPSSTKVRLAEERDEKKKYEEKIDFDDPEQLSDAVKSAIDKGEVGKFAASALIKELAKKGQFSRILKDQGYDVSPEDMLKFGEEILQKKLKFNEQQAREILSEISKENKNNKIFNLTSIVKKQGGKWNINNNYKQDIRDSILDTGRRDRAQLKLHNFVEESADGKRVNIHDAGKEALNTIDPQNIKERMSAKVAKRLQEAPEFTSLNNDVQQAVKDAARSRRKAKK